MSEQTLHVRKDSITQKTASLFLIYTRLSKVGPYYYLNVKLIDIVINYCRMSLRKEGFWEEHYATELRNYEEDGCESEVWFGKGLSRRIVDWIVKNLSTEATNTTIPRVLDVGSGNAYLLSTLVERCKHRDSMKVVGIDYSKSSIDLGRKLVTEKGLNERISLEQCDFLNHDQVQDVLQNERFDFIIDVGTYDAICLLAGTNLEETKLSYVKSVSRLVKDGSLFILASCNHTEEELLSILNKDFDLIDRIETPKLKFGGQEGSQVNCLIMRWKKDG